MELELRGHVYDQFVSQVASCEKSQIVLRRQPMSSETEFQQMHSASFAPHTDCVHMCSDGPLKCDMFIKFTNCLH